MKTITLLIFTLTSLSSIACADLRNKPKWISHRKVECGTILHKIIDPMMTVKGKTLPYGLDLGDMWGKCPDPLLGCFRPHHNIVARGNVMCRAFGLGKYAKTTNYSFNSRDELIALKRNAKGVLIPTIVPFKTGKREYAWVKAIYCHKKY